MHPTAYEEMRRCIERFVPRDKKLTVLDLGSRNVNRRRGMTHRQLLADFDCELIGVDVLDGPNVDLVMEQPYRLPMKSNSVDLVVSGQVFEHIPFFWASMLEVSRVLKPGGLFMMTVPSRGHAHGRIDCWRYYPDGLHALAAFAGLTIELAHTDFPPQPDGPRHKYELIEEERYWGDTVGVFKKPANYPGLRLALVRRPLLWWANKAAGSFVSSGTAGGNRRRGRGRRMRATADSAAPDRVA